MNCHLHRRILFFIFQPQYTTAGQTPVQRPIFQLPLGAIQPCAMSKSHVPSETSPVPMAMPQIASWYHFYQQVPSVVVF